ncbi:hypothetical protein [Paenibacillus turpanensis]|uniref:hypothetical protein n=1 Tax=Paenibacillus turpanensis TaxID=2689078 RepID=UPI00140BCACA|nr:hypothetical protein [Paenibacillus turpanensis]
MGRHIILGETDLTLQLTGMTAFFALTRKVTIPYMKIQSVFVEEFEVPKWMLRMPGTSISFLNIYEGSFKYANEWYFLSFHKKMPLLQLELNGHEKYRYVIVQLDDPTSMAAEIRRRVRGAL